MEINCQVKKELLKYFELRYVVEIRGQLLLDNVKDQVARSRILLEIETMVDLIKKTEDSALKDINNFFENSNQNQIPKSSEGIKQLALKAFCIYIPPTEGLSLGSLIQTDWYLTDDQRDLIKSIFEEKEIKIKLNQVFESNIFIVLFIQGYIKLKSNNSMCISLNRQSLSKAIQYGKSDLQISGSFKCYTFISIEENTFAFFNKIKSLFITGPVRIQTNCFNGLDMLEKLTLLDVLIEVDSTTFDGQNNLQVMRFINCNVAISSHAFKCLKKLESLSFNRCKVRVSSNDSFECLKNLNFLEIHENQNFSFNHGSSNHFKNLNNLETLSIDCSSLELFDKSILPVVNSIKHIEFNDADASIDSLNFLSSKLKNLKSFCFYHMPRYDSIDKLNIFLNEFSIFTIIKIKNLFDEDVNSLNMLHKMKDIDINLKIFNPINENSFKNISSQIRSLEFLNNSFNIEILFSKLNNLECLSFKKCKANKLFNDETFNLFKCDFGNLTRLTFEDCAIKEINEEFFKKNNQIIFLDLKKNINLKISSLTKSLSHLNKLQEIHLEKCALKTSEFDQFSCFPSSLTYLSLNENNFPTLSSFFFVGLVNLKSLILSKCKIENIDNYTFDSIPSIENIDLSDNSIKSLKNDLFKNLTKLIYLNLSNNAYLIDIDKLNIF